MKKGRACTFWLAPWPHSSGIGLPSSKMSTFSAALCAFIAVIHAEATLSATGAGMER